MPFRHPPFEVYVGIFQRKVRAILKAVGNYVYDNLISNRKMYEKRYQTGQSFVPSQKLPSSASPDKYITITFQNSEPLGVELSSRSGKRGVMVKEIFAGTHAEKSGLSRGYIVSRVGGNFVEFDSLGKVVKAIKESDRPLNVVFRPGVDGVRIRRNSSKHKLPPIATLPANAHGEGALSHDMQQIFSNMSSTSCLISSFTGISSAFFFNTGSPYMTIG